MRRLTVRTVRFAIAGGFRIARGAKSHAEVIETEIADGPHRGRGEATPYARYGESITDALAAIEAIGPQIEAGMTRADLAAAMPPSAARNALDCALWDLEAKAAGRPVWQIAGLPQPRPLTTCFTISLDTPDAMAARAADARGRPILKLKLGGAGDLERVAAVRAARPDATLIADANEAWTPEMLGPFLEAMAAHGVALVEQPLPAGQDDVLAGFQSPVPLCADESVHTADDLAALAGRYQAVNLKLDKTGGLTGAIAFAEEAARLGLGLMTGCMVASSLAMAPAMLLAPLARFVDLDGPLLLSEDRVPGIRFDGAVLQPAPPELWG